MISIKKVVAFFMFFAVMGVSTVVAQTPQPAQQAQVEVSDAELTKFVDALKKIQITSQATQQEMMKVVEDGGLEVNRFNEIHQASLDPETTVEATTEEKDAHKKIIAKLDGMQAEIEKQMTDIITKEGLTVERYQQIAMGIQSDIALQQRVQKMLQG